MPFCKEPFQVETGVFGAIFFSGVFSALEERLKREGGQITCAKCKKVSQIEPKTGIVK